MALALALLLTMVSADAVLNVTDESKGEIKYFSLEASNFGIPGSEHSPAASARKSPGSESPFPAVDDVRKSDNIKTPANDEKIPDVHVSGSHYEIGLGIGQRFAGMIKSRFEKDEKLNEILIPYAATNAGRAVVDQLSTDNK